VVVLLFDLDGTILDTTRLILESFKYSFLQGLQEVVTDEELLPHFGRPLEEQFRLMRPDASEATIKNLLKIYREHNHREHDRLTRVVPGAPEALRELARQGFILGVVTSKRLPLTERGLVQFGLRELFQVVVHADSTTRHKPHPEPIEHALALLGAEAGAAAYTGDSPYDMMAAKAAGVEAIGLVYNTFTDDELWRAGADAVFHTWDALASYFLMGAKTRER